MKRSLVLAAAAAMSLSFAGTSFGETTLRIMSWEADQVDGAPAWDKMMRGFEALHPGVKVESNYITYSQYLPAFEAMTAGGSLPDIFFAGVKTAELGRANLVIDYKEFVDDEFLKGFYDSPLVQFTYDNKVYALPWMAQLFGVFTNDRIMKELNLQVPETWDELIEQVPTIRAAGMTPLAWGNLARNVCSDFLLPLVTQYGGDVRALDDHESGVSWDSKPVVDALSLLQRLSKAGVFLDGINGIDEQPAWRIAYEGKAPMLYAVSQAPKLFNTEAPQDWLDNYSVQKVPALTKDSVHWTGGGAGEAWTINANSPNRDLAVELVKYMFQPDVYSEYVGAVGGFPSMPAALESVSDPKIRTMVEWSATEGSDHILFAPGSWEAVSNTCQGILDGSVEPADGARQIEADVVAARAQAAAAK